MHTKTTLGNLVSKNQQIGKVKVSNTERLAEEKVFVNRKNEMFNGDGQSVRKVKMKRVVTSRRSRIVL